MTVLVNKMNVFRTNIHFGLCTTLPDHVSVWTHVFIQILDFDAISDNDLAGQVEISLEETGGPKEFQLLDAKGVPVQKKVCGFQA